VFAHAVSGTDQMSEGWRAAILAVDVAGYSRLMGAYEEGRCAISKRIAATSS
jgi:hypothetical protein